MASYHFAMQIIGRSKGKSSIAAAAYRAGMKLTDPRTGLDHDYRFRRGVAHSEIMLPDGAAPWLADRQKLWGHIETFEKRWDAQVAREINIALPAELNAEDRLALVRDFIRSQFTVRGMVADFAIHEPVPEKGDDPRNHHAHIMLTLRQATAKGLNPVKTRAWNSDRMLDGWRGAWAEHQNRWLEYRGWNARVDHRSLGSQRDEARAQGNRARAESLDREPEIHVGPRARAANGYGRIPTSKPKEVRSRANRPRTRRYHEKDLGTRVQFLIKRMERNLERFDRKITQLQKRLMWARYRHRYLSREEFEAKREQQRLERERVWLQKQAQRKAIQAAFERAQIMRKRQAQADFLIGGIENMLRGLVGIRDQQIKRRYAVRDRHWGFGPKVPRGHGRGRGRPRVWTPF